MTKNPIAQSFSQWMQRNFSHPGTVGLFLFLVFGFLFIEFFGSFFMPVIISVVLAYLLNSLMNLLKKRFKCPHWLSLTIIYLAFFSLFLSFFLVLIPLLFKQLNTLVTELPNAFTQSQTWLQNLMSQYPLIFSKELINHVSEFFKHQIGSIAQHLLQFSIAAISNVVQTILYLVLVPLLVFFFLKDNQKIIRWFNQFMPREKGLMLQLWSHVSEKISCYVRGRIIEIIIVAVLSAVSFVLLGLHYALLLGSMVGIAVIIPYIGFIVVTVPVMIVGLMQWGLSPHFLSLVAVYIAIAIFESHILASFLFSETMDLHPIVIILSVMVFGALWGFWGVFFAIPLTTLCHGVLKVWPKSDPIQRT